MGSNEQDVQLRERAVKDGLASFTLAGLAGEIDAPKRRVYVRGLQDVPSAVIRESAERLSTEIGRRFIPSLPEWLGKCADIVDERRTAAARHAAALRDDCVQCDATGWVSLVDASGAEQVKRCWCWTRGLELIKQAGQPLSRPALPPSSEPETAA